MAAKKKVSKKKTSKSKSMVSMEDYERQMMEDANSDSARAASGGSGAGYMSIKGGTFTYQDADLGDVLPVYILGFASTNAYYPFTYDKDDPNSPACAAVGLDDNDYLEPSDSSPDKQSDTCEECEYNEWGSADTGGGKKCKNGKRLALVHVDSLHDEDVEVAILNVPPTSLTNFKKFVKGLDKTLNRPTYGVSTELSFDDTSDSEKLKFKSIEPVLEVSDMQRIMELRAGIEDVLLEDIDFSNYHEPQKAVRRGKKKVAKKKARKKQ